MQSSSSESNSLSAKPRFLCLAENRKCQNAHGYLFSFVTQHGDAAIARPLVFKEIIYPNVLRGEGWRGGRVGG